MERGTSDAAVHTPSTRRQVLNLANALGYTAGAVALLQAFITASSALAHQADVVALQRGLLAYRDNNGGPWLDPQLARVAPLFVASYLTAAISLVMTLGLAWYAGRLARSLGGDEPLVKAAGRRVACISWLFWAVATTFAVVVLRADGSFSWAFATEVKLAATPAADHVVGLYVTAPDLSFIVFQLVALFFQLGFGLAIGLYLEGRLRPSAAGNRQRLRRRCDA